MGGLPASSTATGPMPAEPMADFPRRPPSEVEWEDLLVRIELMPRALRFVLEHVDRDQPAVDVVLATLLEREEGARDLLERAAGLEVSVTNASIAMQSIDTQSDKMERFVRCRIRNFAIVQRRGIAVWGWEARADGVSVTIYQLFLNLARGDVAALAALRGAAVGTVAC